MSISIKMILYVGHFKYNNFLFKNGKSFICISKWLYLYIHTITMTTRPSSPMQWRELRWRMEGRDLVTENWIRFVQNCDGRAIQLLTSGWQDGRADQVHVRVCDTTISRKKFHRIYQHVRGNQSQTWGSISKGIVFTVLGN